MDTLVKSRKFFGLQSNADLKIPILKILGKHPQILMEIVSELGYGTNYRPVSKAIGIMMGKGWINEKDDSSRNDDKKTPKPIFGLTPDGLKSVLGHLDYDDFWEIVFYNNFVSKKHRITIDDEIFSLYTSIKEIKMSEYLESPFQNPELNVDPDKNFPDHIKEANPMILEIIGTEQPLSLESILKLFHNKTSYLKTILKDAQSTGIATIEFFKRQNLIEKISTKKKDYYQMTLKGFLLLSYYLFYDSESKSFSKSVESKKLKLIFQYNFHLLPEILADANLKKLGLTEQDVLQILNMIYYPNNNYFADKNLNQFILYSTLRKLKGLEATKKIQDFNNSFDKIQEKYDTKLYEENDFMDKKLGQYTALQLMTYSASNTSALKRRVLFDFFLAYRELYPDQWKKIKNKIKLEKESIGIWHDECIHELNAFSNEQQKIMVKTLDN